MITAELTPWRGTDDERILDPVAGHSPFSEFFDGLGASGGLRREQWVRAAERLGLDPPKRWRRMISGEINGHDVAAYHRSGGDGEAACTAYEVSFPSLALGLRIRSRSRTRFGASRSVQTGDAEFDGVFDVKAKDVDRAEAVLGSTARTLLLSLRQHVVEVGDGFVSVTGHANPTESVLVANVKRLIEVADVLSAGYLRVAPPPPPADE